MKFEFSYQKVLDLKEKEKDHARQEFGTIKQRQIELQEQMDELDLIKEKVFSQYNDIDRKSIWEITELQQSIEHVNMQKKRLQNKSLQLFQQVEQKQQDLIEKTQEARIWNQWKEKSQEAFQRQLDRKEQAMLDEMAVLSYSRRV